MKSHKKAEPFQRSLLAAFAHPDDEAFAAGGTLAGYAAEGVEVRLVCATRGEAGSPGEPPRCEPTRLGAVRARELRQSCRALGIADPVFLGARDGQLYLCQPSLIRQFVAAMRRFQPRVVITWGPEGLTGHPDHVVVHRAVTAAFAVAGNPFVFPELSTRGLRPYQPTRLYYCALPASLVDTFDTRLPGSFDGFALELSGVADDTVSVAVDISAHRERKLRALECHETQRHDLFRLSPHDLERLCAREYFVLGSGPGVEDGRDDLFAEVSVSRPGVGLVVHSDEGVRKNGVASAR